MFLLATLTLFVDELKKRMRSILGGDGARVWMDYQLAANDQVIFAAQMRAHRSQRGFHRTGALWRLEVDEGFINKHTLRQARWNQG